MQKTVGFLRLFVALALIVSRALAEISSNADPATGQKMLLFGKPFHLQCNSTTGGTFSWKKGGDLIGTGSNGKDKDERYHVSEDTNTMQVERGEDRDADNWTCSIGTGANPISKLMIVFSNPRAKFLDVEGNSLSQSEGDKLPLACQIMGSPLPKARWYKDGTELLEEEGGRINISLTEDPESFTGKSYLTLDALTKDDRGDYTCSAESMDGTAYNATILVRIKDKWAALWPFLGIVIEVVLLCTIIFIYEKRRSKHDQEESDTDGAAEKNVTDNKGQPDVRQRK